MQNQPSETQTMMNAAPVDAFAAFVAAKHAAAVAFAAAVDCRAPVHSSSRPRRYFRSIQFLLFVFLKKLCTPALQLLVVHLSNTMQC